jgi:hypothetical protein
MRAWTLVFLDAFSGLFYTTEVAKMRSTLLIIFLLFCCNGVGFSQTKPFVVVDSVDLDPGPAYSICSVPKDDVVALARLVIRTNGLTPISTSEWTSQNLPGDTPNYFIHIGLLPTTSRGCSYTVNVSMRVFLPNKLNQSKKKGRLAALSAILCEVSLIGLTPEGGVQRKIFEAVEDATKSCLGKLEY